MKKIIRFLAGAFAAGFALSGHAAIITIDANEVGGDNNDCAGYFTVGPGDCAIFAPLDSDGYVEGDSVLISPAIAKFGVDSTTPELYDFDSIDGTEFDAPYSAGGTETFTYTPTGADPALRYWIAKSGVGATNNGGWTLYFDGDAAACDGADKFTYDCLITAASVLSGSFDATALSHVTFYDSLRQVPEPGSLALLGAALLGLGFARRRTAA